jgi:hypothetical protein
MYMENCPVGTVYIYEHSIKKTHHYLKKGGGGKGK